MSTAFNSFTTNLGKEINLSSDTLGVVLTNIVPSKTLNTVLGDITQIANGNGYTTSQFFDESLMAVFELGVTDAQNNWPIKNARISAFHFSNQTAFGPYSLNGTVIGIGANCSGQVVAGINVSLSKVGCLDFQETMGLCFFSANTTSGSGVVSFDKVPVGTYDLVIDGSAVGCAKVVTTMIVTSSMAGESSVIDYSSQVGDNMLVVHVQTSLQGLLGYSATGN